MGDTEDEKLERWEAGKTKMSKSNPITAVGISDPPLIMFGKLLSIDDSLAATWPQLLLGVDFPEGLDARDAKILLAHLVTIEYHGKEIADATARIYVALIREIRGTYAWGPPLKGRKRTSFTEFWFWFSGTAWGQGWWKIWHAPKEWELAMKTTAPDSGWWSPLAERHQYPLSPKHVGYHVIISEKMAWSLKSLVAKCMRISGNDAHRHIIENRVRWHGMICTDPKEEVHAWWSLDDALEVGHQHFVFRCQYENFITWNEALSDMPSRQSGQRM